MKLATIVALAIALKIFTTAQGALADDPQYFATCAVFPIMELEESKILHYCDIYETSCSDYPFAGYGIFPEYCYDDYVCSTCFQCICRSTGFRQGLSWENLPPLKRKVPVDRLPDGLNPNLKEIKSVYAKLKVNGREDAYFRIFKLAYADPSTPAKTRSFAVGMEMETPPLPDSLPNHQSLVELRDCTAVSPTAYALKKGNETILLLRTGSPTLASQ